MKYPDNLKIVRSDRRSLCIQIDADAEILVKAPLNLSASEIDKFIEKKKFWIETNVLKMKNIMAQKHSFHNGDDQLLSPEKLEELHKKAKEIFPKLTAYYANKLNVTYGRITVRHQTSRWGSCSYSGNLNFNCLLMLAPEECQRYIVIHELCHRKEMNHSSRFWSLIESVMPDYKKHREWLNTQGRCLIAEIKKLKKQ